MTMKMKIQDIVQKDNARKDLGDIGELAASIKEKGILVPLIINDKNELVAGYRRLAAAKQAGLKEVPVAVTKGTAEGQKEIQLIENIQRKQMTPSEEAEAFQAYTGGKKSKVSQLATRIGKTEQYILRRLATRNATKEVKEAWDKKLIQLGHIELLVQMDEKQQNKALEFIQENDMTVQNFADQIRWMKGLDFGEIKFRPSEDTDPEQMTLVDSIGLELDPKSTLWDSTDLWREKEFSKEILEYAEQERKRIKKEGILVYNSEKELKEKHPEATIIGTWGDEYKTACQNITDQKKYAVVVDQDNFNDISTTVYRLQKVKTEKEKKAEPKPDETPEQAQERVAEMSAKQLAASRKQRMQDGVREYRREFLIKQAKEHLARTSDKRLILAAAMQTLMQDNSYGDKVQKIGQNIPGNKGLGNYHENPQLFTLPEDALMGYIRDIVTDTIGEKDMPINERIAKDAGFTYEKAFKMDEEYLKPYVKDELIKLCKELFKDKKAEWEGIQKVAEIKKYIIDKWKPGMVPKELQKEMKD